MLEQGGPAILQASFLALCLILMALPALRIVGMYLERQISALELVLYFAVLLAFVAGVMKTWGSSTAWLLGFMYVSLCALYPVFERVSNQRALRRLDDEEIERCKQALDFDPKNAGALEKLGHIYYARGELDEAIDCYERSLELWKEARVKARLQYAVRRKRLAETGNIVCHHCGTENAKGTFRCVECNAPLLGTTEVLEYLQSAQGKRALLWTIGVSLAVGLVFAFVGVIPAIVCNLLFLIAFAGILLYGWVRTL